MTHYDAESVGLLTPAEVCERLGVTNAQLRAWRRAGTGPQHLRLGHRTIRYRATAVEDFVASVERGDG